MLWFKQLRCSFCRKKDSQVEKLVAGPRAYTGCHETYILSCPLDDTASVICDGHSSSK
jgi:hypothetical protein